jgi:hypothetical protein
MSNERAVHEPKSTGADILMAEMQGQLGEAGNDSGSPLRERDGTDVKNAVLEARLEGMKVFNLVVSSSWRKHISYRVTCKS